MHLLTQGSSLGFQGILLGLVFHSSACASVWHGKIIEVDSGADLNLAELAQRLSNSEGVILGEKHDTHPIQFAQAEVIESTFLNSGNRSFTLAWEFLNHSQQADTDQLFEKFKNGLIDANQFLDHTQGAGKNRNYALILEVTKKVGGKLLGLNLPRKDKDPVVSGGLSAAKPGTIPPDFQLGGEKYYERFVAAMEGHASPQQLQNYFAAQCLTDEVMATHLLEDSSAEIRFVVLGGFHTDYFDGTVASLKRRKNDFKISVVRFIDASDYTENELKTLSVHSNYGPIADFIYFVNEPK